MNVRPPRAFGASVPKAADANSRFAPDTCPARESHGYSGRGDAGSFLRGRHIPWLFGSIALAGAVLLAVPSSEICRGAAQLDGLVGSYLYEQVTNSTQTYSVSNLKVEDIYQPTTMLVTWSSSAPHPVYAYQRTGSPSASGSTTTPSWTDAFTWTYDSQYGYVVNVDSWATDNLLNLPSTPPGANPADVHYVTVGGAGPTSTIAATPKKLVTADNQAVDSRYDPRYSTYTLLNHNFGATVYRGGLFAGYAADAARVSRSFLKFSPAAVTPSGDAVWAGRLYGYYLRSMASGSTTVGVQPVTGTWAWDTITWSTAPSLTPGSPTTSITVTHGTPGWVNWDLRSILTGSTLGSTITYGLASTSEASNGWAYFAKKEYDTSLSPYLLYAIGGAR